MVLCFVALIVFGVLGIFSAKYRVLAKEALDCVARTATLRPCQTGFDTRLKGQVVVGVLKVSPGLARVLNKNFQLLSVAFTLLFFASLAYSAFSVYNYVAFGNCNGPDSSAFCVFDAVLGANADASQLKPIAPGVGPTLGNGSAALLEVGCFSCPYTKKTQPALKEFLASHPEVRLEFRVLPIPSHENSDWAAKAAFCADEQNAFWPMHDALFDAQPNHDRENLVALADGLGLDVSAFNACLDSPRVQQRLDADVSAGKAAGIYGTPTFFFGNVTLVGPQSVAAFQDALAGKTPENGATGGACPPPEGVLS
ncbi:DsbA family protein [Candidatus Micrarchaeota archaeon]|nr:DsbA family protein [Candidatus Micrarchaeota archaeon]